MHIIDDADPNKKTEPQPVLLQLRDEVKKLVALQQAKSAQEKRYFTQFGEPQKEKACQLRSFYAAYECQDPSLDSEVEKLISDLSSIEGEAMRFDEKKSSMQQQHAEVRTLSFYWLTRVQQLGDAEADALEEERNQRYEAERQQLEELARKREEELVRKKEEDRIRNEEAQRQADERRAAAAAAYKPPSSAKPSSSSNRY